MNAGKLARFMVWREWLQDLESTLNTKSKPWGLGLLPDDGSREFGATDMSSSKINTRQAQHGWILTFLVVNTDGGIDHEVVGGLGFRFVVFMLFSITSAPT